MQAVKTRDTGPERTVRRIVYGLGYRYRLNVKALPGHPDLVFPRRRQIIFVHGCFWHGHLCSKGKAPKSRLEYWLPKLEANVRRDAAQIRELEKLGWSVLTVWQCETRDSEALAAKLRAFLEQSLVAASSAAQIG